MKISLSMAKKKPSTQKRDRAHIVAQNIHDGESVVSTADSIARQYCNAAVLAPYTLTYSIGAMHPRLQYWRAREISSYQFFVHQIIFLDYLLNKIANEVERLEELNL